MNITPFIRELSEEQATKEALRFFRRELTDAERLECTQSVIERNARYVARLVAEGDFPTLRRFMKQEHQRQAENVAFDAWKSAVSCRYDSARGKYVALHKIAA